MSFQTLYAGPRDPVGMIRKFVAACLVTLSQCDVAVAYCSKPQRIRAATITLHAVSGVHLRVVHPVMGTAASCANCALCELVYTDFLRLPRTALGLGLHDTAF